MAIDFPWFYILVIFVRVAFKRLFRIELEVTLGTLFYGLILIGIRLTTAAIKTTFRAVRRAPERLTLPNTRPMIALDVNSYYNLRGLEVVLSVGNGGPIIRVDLDKYHTLIGGATGTGKTNMINWIIIQLVQRGELFFANYELYLIDLKDSQHDYLSAWRAVTTGYYSIDPDGSTTTAIAAMDEIVQAMHQDSSGKRKVVIMDELAMLTSMAPNRTQAQKGRQALIRLASQLRDRGALLVATQRPVYDTIDRAISGNLERKICLRVDDNKDSARLVLRHRPRTDATALKLGQFILKEPGARNNEQLGRTMLVNLPGDIDRTITQVMDHWSQQDARLSLFADIAGSLEPGASIAGIHRVAGAHHWSVEKVRDAYRNFALAGAFEPIIGRDNHVRVYRLASPYAEAFNNLLNYIKAGQWQAAPEPVSRSEENV